MRTCVRRPAAKGARRRRRCQLPGTFGSLAATPTVPGWAYSAIYLHLQMSAGGGKNFVTSGGGGGTVVAGLNAHADALVEGITYTSKAPEPPPSAKPIVRKY